MQVSDGGRRLSPDEAEALWSAWTTRRDATARDSLVFAYSPMVRYLAARKVRELPAHCELDDLVSCGVVALIEAIDRFDPGKGATFEQYAWTRVAGSIVDELRRQDWASRSARRLGRKVEQARDAHYARAGVPASDDDLATALQLSVEELRVGVAELERADVLSLNAPTRVGEDGGMLEVGDTLEAPTDRWSPETETLSAERMSVLQDAIASLSEREQKVLTLIHVHELQGAEVGRILGVTESRVSQILAGIRAQLRNRLSSYELAGTAV